MKLKVCSLLLFFAFTYAPLLAQFELSGLVLDANTDQPIGNAEVFNNTTKELKRTNSKGEFRFTQLEKGDYFLTVFAIGYNPLKQQVSIFQDQTLKIALTPFSNELSEVVIRRQKEELFGLSRLNPVEGTAIYAGKKSEVVLLDNAVGNFAANNARQIYSQVVGLNIYENNDAGLQLNIGGRGLDPNRTANFNTRQSGYDISADVLGYPESYYTPPAEALSEIQVIRGAASLQYGSQFGGLINFKFKKPHATKKIELLSRQSVGSFGLFTSFNSMSGTTGKFSYYTYFNYKRGDGFRPNSAFDSYNYFGSFNYALNTNTSLTLETTYLHYLAQQAGGLTDTQFEQNINQSNRERNWFEVDWRLVALKLKHKFSTRTDFSLNVFGLDAERNALGFRGDPQRPERNPITEIDDSEAFTRDLIKDEFNNWGAEARLLTRYELSGKKAVFLIGSKYYRANNASRQGPGSNAFDDDFSFRNSEFPSYPHQSGFDFPNTNIAVFGENIFFLNDKLSITPGFRFEHIKTASEGQYTEVGFDRAGNEILRQDTTDNRDFNRSFILLGLGTSYRQSQGLEFYANLSQNYRSVTFSDIRVVNPTFIVDPEIEDENGATGDFGIRGKWQKNLSYDIGGFSLFYNDRIGTILVQEGENKGDRVRKNIGDAIIYGFEMFLDWNAVNFLSLNEDQFRLNPFINIALTRSEYLNSEDNNVKGRQVEFIPSVNLKTGVSFGYKNFMGSLQYTYLSEQYTDAQNTPRPEEGDSREGIIGSIPAYSILDLSASYKIGKFRVEAGINNLMDEKYFTRRATGYPGPGIIPSDPRSFYTTLQFKW
ncbi:TonB-dependent receptor [Fulvivirga sp. M361]|uniref:TonB-dependent receptor n=1 Tax=Fulvivirga sp. M361 TaxID=2594266 RepID=UPI00117AF358|nr:TonB-dependent receptor [Fulvivirga sp. M361]TRX48490.1 TonB-dependent receptor [Fulvivirga sp. M361]